MRLCENPLADLGASLQDPSRVSLKKDRAAAAAAVPNPSRVSLKKGEVGYTISDLSDPQKRLEMELAWLPDTPQSTIQALLVWEAKAMKGELTTIPDMKEITSALARANAAAMILENMLVFYPKLKKSALKSLELAMRDIRVEEVMAQINRDRLKQMVPRLEDAENVKQKLEAHLKQIAAAFCTKMTGGLAPREYRKWLSDLVWEKDGYNRLSLLHQTILEDYIARTEEEYRTALKEAETVLAGEKAKQLPDCQAIRSTVISWRSVTRPVIPLRPQMKMDGYKLCLAARSGIIKYVNNAPLRSVSMKNKQGNVTQTVTFKTKNHEIKEAQLALEGLLMEFEFLTDMKGKLEADVNTLKKMYAEGEELERKAKASIGL